MMRASKLLANSTFSFLQKGLVVLLLVANLCCQSAEEILTNPIRSEDVQEVSPESLVQSKTIAPTSVILTSADSPKISNNSESISEVTTEEIKPTETKEITQALYGKAGLVGAVPYAPIKEPSANSAEEVFTDLTLDLPKLVSLVQKQSLDVAIADSKIEQSKGLLMTSIAPLLPSVRAQQSVERFVGGEIFTGATPISLNRTTLRPTLSVDYQIQTGGKALFDIAASTNNLKQVTTDKKHVFQQTLLQTASEYFTWLRDMSSIDVAKVALSQANEQVQTLEARYRNGFATKLEVLQAKSLRSEKQTLLLKAQNQTKISEVVLAADLNLPLLVKLTPEDARLYPIGFIEKEKTLNQFYTFASQNRPEVKELNYVIGQAKAQLGSSIADLFPTVGLSAYYRGIGPKIDQLDRSKQGQYSISLDLLRNLGLGTLGNIKVNKEKIREAVLRKQKQLKEIEKTLAEAYYNVSLFREQMNLTQQKIKETEEEYRISMARLKTGVGIYLDVAKAQTDLTQAKLDFLTAATSYNNAQVKLLYETGELYPSAILYKPELILAINEDDSLEKATLKRQEEDGAVGFNPPSLH
jgi:outer membrane protein TolC